MPPLTITAEQAHSHYAVMTSELEVDYEKNITRLYQSICDSDWETAVAVANSSPSEAKTWVVRHNDAEENPSGEAGIMWRFLPIHSACARQPPTNVITALLNAYPDGVQCVDDQGMYPLHYACGNQASKDVIRLLLVKFPQAAKIADPQGMLPIHYLACWGPSPSAVSVVDMVLVANREVCYVEDGDGKTPLDLALEAEYPEKDEVVAVLTKWAEGKSKENEAPTLESTSSRGCCKTPEMSRRENQSPVMTGRDLVPVVTKSVPSPYQTSDENINAGALVLSRRTYSSYVGKQYCDDECGENIHNTKQVARLKAEIDKLKADKAFNEAQMEEKIESALIVYRDQISSLEKDLLRSRGEVSFLSGDLEAKNDKIEKLQATIEECEVEISTIKGEKLDMEHQLKDQILSLEEHLLKSQDKVSLLKGELEGKNDKLEKLQATVEECEVEISSVKAENSDLEHHLRDMTEECKKYKCKSSHMNDRLGALSASLTPMIKGQEVIMDSVKKQDEHVRNASILRQARLEEMLEMERFMLKEMDMESGGEGELSNSYKELEKQKREMDAITAVIAAARES